jgi:hypothetical protein
MAQLRDLNPLSLETATDAEAFELIKEVRFRRRTANEAAQAKRKVPREKKIPQDKLIKAAKKFSSSDIERFKQLIGAS